MSETDLELLARYGGQRAEDAFAELVRRHVDLVFSAALRQVRSPQLAEEVAQSAFTDLARQADRLAPGTILSAWLYQVTRRTAIDVVRREARRQLREQVASELNAMNATDADWTQIEPMLDEAMETLEESERNAVVLRYFENRSLREVGQALGTTEEAARKRVSRAVERLREFLMKRGVTAGAGALAAAISANAVQGAPLGLSAALSAAALAGTTAFTTAGTATATVTKTIVMTTLQKAAITATLVAAAGMGIYEARQVSHLRQENQTLQQQNQPLAEQVALLQRERDEARNRLAAAEQEIARAKSSQATGEVLKLRGQVGVLQRQLMANEAQSSASGGGMLKLMNEPRMKEYIHAAMLQKIKSMYEPFFQELKLRPEQVQKVVQLLGETASKGLATLAAAPGSADQAAARQTAAEAEAQADSQLQSLLGEAGYARFKEFSREIPARTTLTQLKDQAGDNQLDEQQSARLLQVIKAEPYELTQGITGSPDKAFLGSQADIDQFLERVTESNQHILQQAGSFLTPEQLGALNTVLTNAIETRKLQGEAFMPKP